MNLLILKDSLDIEDIIAVNYLDLRDTLSDKPVAKPKALLTVNQASSVAPAAPRSLQSWIGCPDSNYCLCIRLYVVNCS